MQTPTRGADAGRLPAAWWLIPATVALLRMLPVLSLDWAPPPPGQTYLGVSYLPADFLAYSSLVRQVSENATPFFYDPFTSEPQTGRFLFLFHWVVGLAARVTGASAVAALEWSRVPAIFACFAALAWFLRPIFPERRDRIATLLLVAFASGIESFLLLLVPELPEAWALRLREDTSPYYGWSLFASFFNPLWSTGLALGLLVLRPLLFTAERSRRALVGAGALLFLLFFVHPYTAIGVCAITGATPVVAWLLRQPPTWRRELENALVLGAALVATGALSLWQLQDPVYRASSGGIFGSFSKSVLWYPVTLGVLGVLALAGGRRFWRERHPARFALFGWVAAIVLLQTLPILNGYKFVFLLPLPLCVLAAPAARELFARRAWLAAGVSVLLFGGALLQTVEAVRSTRAVGAVPSDLMRAVETLVREPAGNALTSPGVGNVLPAFTSHRVFVGHWFMTPEFTSRSVWFRRFVWDPGAAAELRRTVRVQGIRYVIVPSKRADYVAGQLAEPPLERRPAGELEVLILR